MKIKTGQQVKIMSGKDKGKEGKVVQVFPKLSKVVVDGINKGYRHIPKREGQKGERIEYFGPIHVSNVKLIDKGADKADAKAAKKEKKAKPEAKAEETKTEAKQAKPEAKKEETKEQEPKKENNKE